MHPELLYGFIKSTNRDSKRDVNEMVGSAWLLETVDGWALAECRDRNGGEGNFVWWKFLSIEQQLHGVGHPNVPELHCLTLGRRKRS